jgi:hypothetical protein
MIANVQSAQNIRSNDPSLILVSGRHWFEIRQNSLIRIAMNKLIFCDLEISRMAKPPASNT